MLLRCLTVGPALFVSSELLKCVDCSCYGCAVACTFFHIHLHVIVYSALHKCWHTF
uniref:Uncharacterized protein n=1 Tax=Anguilla anguilla TaxID=7936 RepID=A0A0E9RW05_ANGAN